ncbi:glycosyltransferase [Nitrospirillum viridazoti]|uniref:Glycosyltransferase involved in cell wall biosynthesis n=1 Tax=Nitrospirillum amazonense TaxID=28077 RepID=A0A560I2S1_9PROT|nr:glycosyltransferase [Nitrospirillum amazonense]TWB51514.1 glycosyltransferase involved in cell wall biosynthesis [Nitrospirillum amazonense]
MKKSIRVQICNERFLSRFGLDRVLLQAAHYFRTQGAEVSLAALRYDQTLVDSLGFKVEKVIVPEGLDMQATERQTTHHMLTSWLKQRPDVVMVGGWPFFDLASKSPALGVPSCYPDVGAVPHDGLSENATNVQQELRRIRALTQPFISSVLPISDFIRLSQTERDRGHTLGVRTVLIGTDHLATAPAEPGDTHDALLAPLRDIKATGGKLIINLGRFEGEGYKNSFTSFTTLRNVRAAGIDARLIVLGQASEFTVPPDLAGAVLPIGNPSDSGLLAVMREADLGLTTSLWEGFNLPLAEMQNIGKPVLAFVAGAHSEVVADPWFLCANVDQMALKAKLLLGADADKVPSRPLQALARYARRLPWSATLENWWQETVTLARHTASPSPTPTSRRLVLVDLSNSCRDPANSGVIRVSRQLTKRLQRHPGLDVVCVRWDSERYSYSLINPEGSYLANYSGPQDYHGIFYDPTAAHIQVDRLLYAPDPRLPLAPIMFMPEICLDGTLDSRVRWARDRNMFVSTILHDLIAYYHKQYCTQEVVDGFASYLPPVLHMDQIITVSEVSLTDLRRYANAQKAELPLNVQAVWLPAQFSNVPRHTPTPVPAPPGIRILCVSTIEPRKNHRRLVEAFGRLVRRRPDLSLRLTLVGNRYVGADELAEQISAAEREGIAIEWRGILSDQELLAEYAASRFTVYPSVFEGFGLPIMESLWLGKPVICSQREVMAELAQPGGCLTTDVFDVDALSDAMERLATDDILLARLQSELAARSMSDWEDYAMDMGNLLYGLGNPYPTPAWKPQMRKGVSACD